MTLPDRGDLDWDTPVNDAIEANRSDAADAAAIAAAALNDSAYAKQRVDQVYDFVVAPTDEQIAGRVADDDSASADAVDGRVDTKVDPIRDLSDTTFAANLRAATDLRLGMGGIVPSRALTTGAAQDSTIAAELTGLSAFGGGVLVLPAGTITVVGNITPPTNCALRGAGMDRTTIKVTGPGRGVLVIDTPNVTVEDLTVDMNKANTADGGSSSIQQGVFVHASNSTGCPGTRIRRVRVKNSWRRGIDVRADTLTTHPLDAIVEDCEVYDNGDNAAGSGSYGIHCEYLTHAYVRRNRVERNGGYGIRVAGCAKAAVDDNFVDNHQNNHGIVVNNATVDMSVCRNRVFRSAHAGGVGQTQWGIVIGISAAQFVVADNLCDGNEGGMTIDVATTDPAEFINTTGVVANNVLVNCTRTNAALNINRVDGLVISGNECAYSNQHGISITARHCSVVGNHIHHNQQRGIEFLESGTGCGPHFYGDNYLHDNNLVVGSWKDFYSDTLTNGSVDVGFAGITASIETDTTVSNTTTKTTVVSLATSTNPPPQPGDRLLLRFNGDVINHTAGAVTYKFEFKLGSTVIVESSATSFSSDGATLTPRHFYGEMLIAVVTTSSQIVSGQILGFGSSSGMVIGTGGAYGAIGGTAAENLAASKNVQVAVTMNTASADAYVTVHSASLERIPRRR